MQRRQSQALFSGAQRQDKKQRAQTETQDVPSENEETLFYCKGDHALAQVTQRDGGVPILGHIQKPSGHGSGQPAWVDLLKCVGGGPDDLQRSIPTSALLCICRKTKQVVNVHSVDN